MLWKQHTAFELSSLKSLSLFAYAYAVQHVSPAADTSGVHAGQGEAQAAGEEVIVGDVVMGEAEVVDLVPTIEEKPADAPEKAKKA